MVITLIWVACICKYYMREIKFLFSKQRLSLRPIKISETVASVQSVRQNKTDIFPAIISHKNNYLNSQFHKEQNLILIP